MSEKQEWKDMVMVLQIEKSISSAVAGLGDEGESLLYENACHLIHQYLQVCVCLLLVFLACICILTIL